ncbi:NAD(P)/FAD-dependent oxidoreductase [Ferrovibrio xuzhouensis]|uniref:NAD(P)/FAD-dependent oxidoreductase n=1 Tax=Ferrovibrio xuzhouensis TaxID=1576914 RepID=A0ABV7VPA7_9PROT
MVPLAHSPNADSSGMPFTPYSRTGGTPLWCEPLGTDIEADIVIVGGGIAGISTALHASLAGLKAVVLEGKEVGWGASSRNSGHIPAATRQEPSAIMRSFGPVHGRRIIDASREAPELVYGLAERYGMDASAVRAGGIQAAHNATALEKLRRRVSDLHALGYEVRLLDAEETASLVGCAPGVYKGAVFDPAGGTLNPLAYVRGLARAAIGAGARICEHTMVHGIERSGDGWLAKCRSGSVRARFAIVSTNGYGAGLLPRLWRSVIAIRAYQFMTEPLPEDIRRTVLPQGQGFTDTRRLMSGIRIHKDGRLHFSGIGPLFGPEREPNIDASMARVRFLFPQIKSIAFDYWWSGWMAMNQEHSWKIHEVEPRLLAILGCNGRGVGLATIYGRELADYIAGKPAADLALPLQPVKPIAVHPFRRPLVGALATGYRVMDALETALSRPDRNRRAERRKLQATGAARKEAPE